MAINATSANSLGAAAGQAVKKADDNSSEAIQDRFMTLLVAQLKNQDPLEPMDNSQVTSQMAQLSTVTGIQGLNDSMQSMASTFSGNQTLQATSMLGRTVTLNGDGLTLKEGNSNGSFELKQAADKVSVNVLSASGEVLQTIDAGALSKGVHEFSWDGKGLEGNAYGNGNYRFEVVATAAGQPAEVQTLSQTTVSGVRNGADGVTLLTADGSEVSVADIKQIF